MFSDDFELLPGGFLITNGEIRKYYEKLEYAVFLPSGEEVVVQPVSWEDYMAYFTLWDDFHVFGMLPHGKGPVHELPWVVDIIKYFDYISKEIESFRIKKR